VEVDDHGELLSAGERRHEHSEAEVVGLVVDDVLPSDRWWREDLRQLEALDGAVAEELDDALQVLHDVRRHQFGGWDSGRRRGG